MINYSELSDHELHDSLFSIDPVEYNSLLVSTAVESCSNLHDRNEILRSLLIKSLTRKQELREQVYDW